MNKVVPNGTVLHIVPALFRTSGVMGGAERYVFELARHMATHQPTTLLTFGDRTHEERTADLHIRVIGGAWRVRGQQNNSIALALITEVLRASIIHCHQQHVLASSIGAIVARMARRKVFVTDLGGGGCDISSYVSTDRLYNAHLHISEYSRSVFGHVGKPWAHVIYGGVDTAKFSPATDVRRDGTVLYVGRILPHKGIDYLIRALPDTMRLEIVGQPYHSDYLRDLRQLARNKNVIFTTDASDNDLVAAYRRCLCIVLPSVYQDCYGHNSTVPELLGQTLLEGMACGAPGICTNVAAMPEVVRDGTIGFIVPPNDPASLGAKLLWLRQNSRDAAAMGVAARQHVLEQFTWDRVVKRCLEIYRA